MDSHREEAADGSNMFLTLAAFEKYSQLSRITHLIATKDELLKKEQKGNKDVDAKKQNSVPKKSVKKGMSSYASDGASNTTGKETCANNERRKVSIRIPFPRLSWFTKKQHAEYLRLYAKFLKGPPSHLSVEDNKQINMFKEMQLKVIQEQDEFLRYLEMVAKQSVNDYNYIHPEAERFIDTYLNKERQRVLMYPCFYKLLDGVPLATQKSGDIFTLHHEAILLELGHLSRIIQPKVDFHQKCFVPLNFDKVNARFPVSDAGPQKLPPCSQDPNCMVLADKYDADIVMSASAMACLLDNQSPSYSRQWELPFKILLSADTTEAVPKSRVFLDKPFAPKVVMPREKNELYHRFATKTVFEHPRHNTSCTMEELRTPRLNSFNGCQEETCFSSTKEIVDLEVFGTEESQSETDPKDHKQSETSTLGSATTVGVMVSDTVTNSEALPEDSDVKGAIQVSESVVLTVKPDKGGSHCTKDKRNELTTVMKIETDSNGNIKNTGSSAITEDDQNTAQEIKSDCSQKVKNMFSFSDDADDTEDEKLVIDAPATPAKMKQNMVGDLEPWQKEYGIRSLADSSTSPTESRNTLFSVESPIPTSLCVATPLSPPYTSMCTTPSHVPIIPLEKVDLAVIPSSQQSNKHTETFLHIKSSRDTALSPYITTKTNTKVQRLDTTNNRKLESSKFEKLSSNLSGQGNDAQGSDTDGELVIDMTTQGEMKGSESLSSVKEEGKDNITNAEPVAGNTLIGTVFASYQMKKDEVKCEQQNEECFASVSIPSSSVSIPSSLKQVDIIPDNELTGISSISDHLREEEGRSGQSNDLKSESNRQMDEINTERVYNLRKRPIEVSPSRSATDAKIEEPKPKRRLRSHTAALPVERMLRSRTRAMSSRQKSSGSLSQLDGTEDRQNEEQSTSQQKTKAKTVKCDQSMVTCPLDNILEAQNKLLDVSFTANLLSQASQKSCDTGQMNIMPSHLAVKSGLKSVPSGQMTLVPGQADITAGQNSALARQACTIIEDDNSNLFQGDAIEDASDYKKPPSSNVSYSLYKLGNLRIIVRYKYHGILRCKKKTRMHLAHLQPKLEYQPQYGLEQLTHSEICRAWLALQLRPQTSLVRVRINAYSGDILDQEVLTRKNVLPCRSPFHPGYAMSNLHKMFLKLKRLPAGDFLLSHNPGQLCCHIKTTTTSTSGVYDLHKAYLEQSANSASQYTDVNIPWIPIDPGLMLPFHKKYQCIPATFEPKDSVPKHTYKPNKKKKNKKKAN